MGRASSPMWAPDEKGPERPGATGPVANCRVDSLSEIRFKEGSMKECLQFYIDGKWVTPAKAKQLAVVNPATEEKIAVISMGTADHVDQAVKAAKRAFVTFSETSVDERMALLGRIIEVYQSKYDEMATTISEEMGAPMWLARAAQAAAGLAHFMEMQKVLGAFKFEE